MKAFLSGGKIGMSARNAPARRLAATPADVLTRMRRALDASARKLWLGGALTLDLSVTARTMILFGVSLADDPGRYSYGAQVAADVRINVLAPVLPLTVAGVALGVAAALIGATLYLRDAKLWLVYLGGQLATLVALVVATVIPMAMIGVVTEQGGGELALECYWLFTAVHACALVLLSLGAKFAMSEIADEHMPAEVSNVPAPRAAPPPPPPPRDNRMY
jgi:hypothetical protein